MRAAYRLIAPRSAAASGRRLTGRHPHASALLRQCLNRKGAPPAAFFGRAVFLCTVPLPLLSVVIRLAQRKPPSDSVSMEHSWGKSSQKLLLCVTVEAGKVGDYGSYYRLTHTAPAPAHTPAQPDHRRQPMRWTPLRTIAEVTPVLYPAPVAAPSLAEYSKGSSTLCDGHPFG